MTTKLTLLALLALPLFAAPQVLERPGDAYGLADAAGKICPDSEGMALQGKSFPQCLIITKQEAADVVKALEIFSSPEPSLYPEEVYSSNAILLNAGTYILGDENTPAGLRRKADWLEKLAKEREQRAKDLAWARGVLETWRGKVKEAGK